MPLASTLSAYPDIPMVLDPIVAAGGGTYRLPTAKKATAWRQRAYHYRNLLRKELSRQSNLKGYVAPTIYDTLIIRQEEELLTMTLGIKIEGEITLADGTTHVPEKSAPASDFEEEDDPVLREAMALMNLRSEK